jgi:Protein of unknown function (DUF4038)
MNELTVSKDKRSIVNTDGLRFFYLADTCWEAVHRLTREDIDHLVAVRARQKFTALQVVCLAEFDGLNTPNRYGHRPLENNDPLKPVEAYWQHVDYWVEACNRAGLWATLLPTWGDKVTQIWGTGPVIFTDEKVAYQYGQWIGKRYASKNVIWMNGGDRPVRNESDLLIWRAIGQGIKQATQNRQLMTFHPNGGNSSSHYVHDEEWLDINSFQSGHTLRDNPTWEWIWRDLSLTPAKPSFDSEPNYENHKVMAVIDGKWVQHGSGRFDAHDMRKQAYRSILAGACGFTYGCHDIWQMYDPAINPAVNHACLHWKDALELPGANQMYLLPRLVAGLDRLGGIEFGQGLLVEPGLNKERMMVCAKLKESSGCVVYSPVKQKIRLVRSRLGMKSTDVVGTWWCVRTGESFQAKADTSDINQVCFEDQPLDEDYVLVASLGRFAA